MKWIEFISRRFAALSARERGGLALVGALVSLFFAASSFEWALDGAQAAQAQHDARVEAEAALRRQTSPAFRQQVGLAAGHVWRWSVVESSLGAAQARVASEVESLASQAGLANVVVAPVSERVEAASRLSKVSVSLVADFDWSSFLALLDALATADVSYTIADIDVSGAAGQGGRLSVTVQAPFLRDGY